MYSSGPSKTDSMSCFRHQGKSFKEAPCVSVVPWAAGSNGDSGSDRLGVFRRFFAGRRAGGLLLPLLLTLLVVVSACGKKGPPEPPVKLRPVKVTDLDLWQRGDEVVLRFTLPTLTSRGTPLDRIGRVLLLGVVEEEPAHEDAGETKVPRGRFMPVYEFLKKAETLETFAEADFPRFLVDGKAEWHLSLAGETIGAVSPRRYYYAVAVEDTEGRESDLSNIESLVPMEAPAPPRDLEAVSEGGRVKLTWSPAGTGPSPAAYTVYRLVEGNLATRLLLPDPAKTSATDFNPPKKGQIVYLVYASRTKGEPFIESKKGAKVEVDVGDRTPPGVPKGVRVSSGESGLEVYWMGDRAGDIAHYLIYRGASATGPFEETARVASGDTSFVDKTAESGTVYYYAVAAIDAAGNESPRSESARGRR